jgi:drug/metabolite transporter (DMT)-like permease
MLETNSVGDRSLLTAALGALCIASSGVLVRLAEASPATVAVFRCLYALPLLGLITHLEQKRSGPLPAAARKLGWVAGFFFSVDLILWHNAIEAVGAGLATVLGNLQVLLVAFAAWALLGERPQARLLWAIPIMGGGVILISGVVGADAYGKDPALGVLLGIGTSIAYAAFILTLRQGSSDLRRVAGPLFHATLASAVFSALYGMWTGTLDWSIAWPSHGWLVLLALSAQVMGWLLISRSLPRLPAAVTSVVLLLQPVAAMVLAAIVVAERPSPTQLAGAMAILAGVVLATSAHRGPKPVPNA